MHVVDEVNGIWTYDFQVLKIAAPDALVLALEQIYDNYAQAVTFP